MDRKQYARVWVLVSAVCAGCAYETHSVEGELEWVAADAGLDDDGDDAGEEEREAAPGPGRGREHGRRSYSPSHPDRAVAAAIEAWRERSVRAGDVPSADTRTCETRFEHLEIVMPTDDDFRRLCQRCNTTDSSPHCSSLGRVNACAPFGDERDDDGEIGPPHGLVVVDPALAADARVRDHLVIHEAIHHLGDCTRFGSDRTHASPELWAADPDSIEAAAQRSM